MNTPLPDLTPPGKNKPPKNTNGTDAKAAAPKTEKPKAEKAPKVPRDPNAPKKERAPRADYGFRADATISVDTSKPAKTRGNQKKWYDSLVAHNGKTVAEWIAATKTEDGDPPRGWLRHFVQDGYVTLIGGTVPVAPPKTPEVPPPTA